MSEISLREFLDTVRSSELSVHLVFVDERCDMTVIDDTYDRELSYRIDCRNRESAPLAIMDALHGSVPSLGKPSANVTFVRQCLDLMLPEDRKRLADELITEEKL